MNEDKAIIHRNYEKSTVQNKMKLTFHVGMRDLSRLAQFA